jgi:hypothetical protein
MALQVNFKANGRNVHAGPGFLFHNPLRPLYGMRALVDGSNPPNYKDPPTPSAWAATTAVTVGQIILDSNNNVQVCTTTGTTGASAPTWNTLVGGQTSDGAGGTTAVWTCAGPSWIWAATTAVIPDQQFRDANGNIHECILGGTTAASLPSPLPTIIGTVWNDGTAQWMCLGPTLALGGANGAMTFDVQSVMADIDFDQFTLPVDAYVTGDKGTITATLMELSLAIVGRALPTATYLSGVDPNLPSGAQAYEELLGGGMLRVPHPAIMIASPQREFSNPAKCFVGVFFKAAGESNASLPFSLKKETTFKASWKAQGVVYRPAGYQGWQLYRET